jgi:hypothetical protein
VDYDAVATAMLRTPADVPAAPVVPDTPARRLRDALEPVATHAWWCEPTNRRMEALGLLFFPAYVWGRAAALGEPAAAVVVSSFGVFEPGFLTAIYEEGRAACDRDAVLEARSGGTVASLATLLDGEDVETVAAALADAVGAVDGTARPLFSGLRALPWPDEPVGRLWRAAELVREHRGDGHLAACIAAGLDAVEMTVLTELWLAMPSGGYLATRGYGADALAGALDRLAARGLVDGGALTGDGRRLRDDVEARTDAAAEPVVRALGDRLDGVVTAAARWSQQLVDARAFPADPNKRAAG